MGERFVHEGIEYEDIGGGNVRVIGPATSGAPAPSPTAPQTTVLAGPRAPDPVAAARDAAALEGLRLQNEQRRQALAEGNGREGATNADNAADARRANLTALVNQINTVQSLFDQGPGATTGVAGLADYLPTSGNQAFDAAGASLVDQAAAAFRVPGVGAQSDADAARLAAAIGVSSSDRDAVIQQRLNQLRQRVETTMRELGMPAPQWGTAPPTTALGNLPRASLGSGPGATAPAMGQGVAPVGEGAYHVPQLAGLANEVAGMVQRGDNEAAIMRHIEARHAEARRAMPGLQVSPDMGGFVSAIVAAHRRNPSVPVGSLADAWGALEMARDVGGSGGVLNAIGQAADTTVGAAMLGAINGVTGGLLANEAIVGDNAAQALDASRFERPTATTVGDIAGTTAAMLGVGQAARGMGAAGRALTAFGGVGGDAAYGAVRGFNEAAPGEGMGGAALGAVAGAGGNLAGRFIAAPVARAALDTRAGQALATGAVNAGRAVGNAGRGMFGRSPMPYRQFMAPQRLSNSETAMLRSIENPSAIADTLERGAQLGVPLSIADVAPGARSLAGAAWRRASPATRETFEPVLDNRYLGQADRALGYIDANIGPTGNPNRISEQLLAQGRARAAPLYDAAFAQPPVSSATLDELLSRPALSSAMSRAATTASNRGEAAGIMEVSMRPDGTVGYDATPNLRTLDYLKRELDGEIGALVRSGNSTDLSTLQGVRTNFVNELDSLYPGYSAARAAYAGPARANEALEAGRAAMRTHPRDIADHLRDYTGTSGDMYRLGGRTALADAVTSRRNTGNVMQALTGGNDAMQRLALLGSPTGADTMGEIAGLERGISATTRELLGGSPTAARQVADEQLMGGVANDMGWAAAETLATGAPTMTLARRLAPIADRYRLGLRATARADEMLPELLQMDSRRAAEALRATLVQDSVRRGYVNRLRRRGGMFGGAAAIPVAVQNQP